MAQIYPPELQQFLDEELASGQYESESELVIQALRVYRELKTRHESLRKDVETAIVAADRGQVAPLDIDAVKSELTDELDESGRPK